MKKHVALSLAYLGSTLAILSTLSLLSLLCSQPTAPRGKPRLAPVADISAFAGDTVRLSVVPLFAPDTIAGYIWSLRGTIKTVDTTKTNTILRSWSEAQCGVCTLSVKIFDNLGVVSDSVVFRVSIDVCRPALSIIADTLVDFSDPCLFTARPSFPCGHMGPYIWSYDGGLAFPDTSRENTISKHWARSDTGRTPVVVVKARVAQGQFTEPTFFRIHVVCCRPSIAVKADSVGYVGETSRFSIVQTSTCQISNYLWSFDKGTLFTDTTFNPTILKQWQAGDTGTRIIFAAAQTVAGIMSPPATFRIRVGAGELRVTLPQDTVCVANDTVHINARTFLSHSTISQYIWSIDNSDQTLLTKTATLSYYWPPAQIGAHTVRVRVVDEQGQFAVSNSMNVTVKAIKPILSVPRDTLVRAKDTVVAMVHASSGAGNIVRYLWNVGSLSWTDSTDAPQRKIWRQAKDTVVVMVGALDAHGNLGIDSFHVFFNAPPANVLMLSPKTDTICFRSIDGSLARGEVPFVFSASDRNGASDSLTYGLSLGKSPTTLAKVYEGRATSYVASKLDTARYFWSLVVKDRLGDSAAATGSFVCIFQRTVCFAGHSIIVGLGGSTDSGGIRRKMLATLRSRKGGTAKVSAIGPLPTGYLEKKDDSCIAVSSYRAKDVMLLMRNNFPTLTADIWVVMLGVNDKYSSTEFQNLTSIINLIYGNNPLASTYVINGLQFQPAYGQDTVFNKWLADSVKVWQNNKRSIWNINAYKLFSTNNAPNLDLFSSADNPPLHPSQKGYDSLAQMILDTMKFYNQP